MKRLSLLILLYYVSLTVITAKDCGSKYGIKLPCYDNYLDRTTGAGGGYEGDETLPLYPYAKRPNGCSILGAKPGTHDAIRVENVIDVSFKSACNQHDKCYYSLDTTPTSCNWIMGRNMRRECDIELGKLRTLDFLTLGLTKSASYSACITKAEVIQSAVTLAQGLVFFEARKTQKDYIQRINNFIRNAKKSLTVPFNGSSNYWLKFTDPEKYELVYSIAKSPDHGSLHEIKSGNVLGYRYVPNNLYEGEDDFTIFINDTKNTELVQNISVKVLVEPNNAPNAKDKTYATNVNTFPIGPLNSIVFTSPAFDPDGHDISYTVVTEPLNGEIKLLENKKSFEYIPNKNFGQGVKLGTISKDNTDKFTYRATDQYGKSDIGTVSFIIYAKNHLVIAQKTNSSTGTGTIKSDPAGINYPSDVIEYFAEFGYVTFTATADKGSIFTGWNGSCTSSDSNRTCTLLMDDSKQVLAKFDLEPTSVNLSVNKSGDGSGTIESDSANINCGDDCTESYSYGLSTPVVLNAEADDNSVFIGWEGACKGKEPCTIYMSQDLTVTAKFLHANPKDFQVTNLHDQGSGSLRQAVIDANANPGKDTISFSRELKGSIILDSGELSIKESLIINGPGANILSISGNNTSRLFYINPGSFESVTINGLTLKEGFDTTGNGGSGIMIDSGDVNLNTLSMHHNSANGDIGGGGAIRKFGLGSLKISKSTFYSNSALTVDDEGVGGAIRIDTGRAVIVNSTLSKNSSAFGGAVAVGDSATLILNNSTLSGNTATGWGGGISNDGIFKVSNSIISANSAPTDSDIFASSLSSSEFLSSGYNIFGENGNTGISSDAKLAESDIILDGSIDVVIGSLKNNGGTTFTHLVVENGPAFAAGSNDLYIGDTTTTDQRGEGYYRFMKDSIDIGSVEKYAPIIMPSGIQVDNNGEIKIMPIQGYPVAVSLENESLASVQIDSFGLITIKGKLVGSTTMQAEDIQGNVSKTLIEVSITDDNSPDTPLSDDGTNTLPATNPVSGGGGGGSMHILFLLIFGGLLLILRRKEVH